MNGLGTSQLDVFLTFSDLHLLTFSSKWKLVDLHPSHRNFLGWDESNMETYQFANDFLEPNHLDLQRFLGLFNAKEHVIKNFYFRDQQKKIQGPFPGYLRIRKEQGQIKSLMIFVRLQSVGSRITLPPEMKYKQFIGEMIPGLIHNMNGPLGTINGRIELLKYKYPHIQELNEILKMGFKLQSIIENLSFKIVNERYFQPTEINLNRLLREEVKFLNGDLFFKHRVEKEEKYTPNIPQFRKVYLSLSGVLSETYHFIRKFIYDDSDYYFQIESFYKDGTAGYSLKFMGDFHLPDNSALRFPLRVEGDAVALNQQTLEGLDLVFLAFCLRLNGGRYELTGRKELMSMRLAFPIEKS